MLDDRELGQNFLLIHFNQSRADLAPRLNCADAPQLIGVFRNVSRLYLLDVVDAPDEHEFLAELFDGFLLDELDGLDGRSDELRASPNERNELVIVQTPNAMLKMEMKHSVA